MDRFPDLALLAMDATAEASRPRRRWSDGPRYAWAEESGAAEWSLEPMWPKISACASECMAQVAAALGREIARLQLDGRVHPADAKSLSSLAESLARSSRGVQQVVRLGGGRVQLAAERVDLVALVRDTVHDMQADLRSRGAEVTFDMRPSEVLIDPSLALG
ncbi:MAG TPA: hypothetical protein VIE63_00510, partial [Ramlibacter sp.]